MSGNATELNGKLGVTIQHNGHETLGQAEEIHETTSRNPFEAIVLSVRRHSSFGGKKHYNPHHHRVQEEPTTNTETLIHLLKGSLGTGILAMPDAFANAGLLVGFFGTIIVGILCTYCMHILVRSQYELCKRLKVPILSYPKSMEVALEQGPGFLKPLSKYAGIVVDFFLVVYQLGICCVYIMFVASNIKQVVDEYWHQVDVRIYMTMLLVPLILLTYIRNLKRLAPFSVCANIITFIGLGMTLYYIFNEIPSPSVRPYVGQVRNFPLFIGTTMFALEGVGLIIALENNMKKPEYFGGYTGILNRAMLVIISLYVSVGFLGYTKYGDEILGSVTLNLPATEILAQAVKIMFAAAIFITYALQGYVPVDIVWNSYLKKRFSKASDKRKLFYEYIMRTVMVLITFVLAVAIPRLGLFISLFGALCLSALGIAFPSLMEFCVLWPNNYGFCKWILFKDIGLFLFGLFGLVIGTYTSLLDIIVSLQESG